MTFYIVKKYKLILFHYIMVSYLKLVTCNISGAHVYYPMESSHVFCQLSSVWDGN